METPRCFISYSWDSERHQEWVLKLANRLRECGVNAILDKFYCAPGTDLTKFMEKSVRESGFVLLICTPNFAKRANDGLGGVGYETQIVTGEIFVGDTQETKFVPLLRDGQAKESLPSYLKSRFYIDFRKDILFEIKFEELLRHLHGEPCHPLPPLGAKPDWTKHSISRHPDPSNKLFAQKNMNDSSEAEVFNPDVNITELRIKNFLSESLYLNSTIIKTILRKRTEPLFPDDRIKSWKYYIANSTIKELEWILKEILYMFGEPTISNNLKEFLKEIENLRSYHLYSED